VEFEIALPGLAAFLIAATLTAVLRKRAVSIDVPNARSSHRAPTPRGGGLAAVLATTLILMALVSRGAVDMHLFWAVSVGGLAVAVVGFIDDRRAVSPKVRLAVHLAAAIWALAWLGGLPPLQLGDRLVEFGWGGYVLGVLGIVWALNLFNFMDGVDGLAGSQAVFVALAGCLLQYGQAESQGAVSLGFVFAGACAGFLAWNWPPAKIFMGDVGSGYMGYTIAVLALALTRENPVALLVWVILGGVFFMDATITLLRRWSRGERVLEAHRNHAYQWLAQRWQSHGCVTVITIGINVLWLLPSAWWATRHPPLAGWILLGALVPVGVGCWLAGAGRRDR
jgi:Fuc2NAc and GlcNAc transferase